MVTLVSGDGPLVIGEGPVRTGVTAMLPRGRGGVGVPCAAGWYSLNGNGEMTGMAWVDEVGAVATPVLVTSTHSVGACHTGVIQWAARNRPDLAVQWLLPVVAETWDGYLNDVSGGHVRPEHAVAAIDAARGGPVPQGSVGGGTGMVCYGFKGGTGTASRLVEHGGTTYTVGVLLQANFGSRAELVVGGVPVGRELPDDNAYEAPDWLVADQARAVSGMGSCIAVVVTDAPLLPGQCAALARRVPLGLARTGTAGSHFSGDLFLALSTANEGALTSEIPTTASAGPQAYESMRFVPWGWLDPFLTAVVEAVEEAVLNVLLVNADMTGRDGHRVPALPTDRLLELLARGHSPLSR
jgi:D-aminopeptidase